MNPGMLGISWCVISVLELTHRNSESLGCSHFRTSRGYSLIWLAPSTGSCQCCQPRDRLLPVPSMASSVMEPESPSFSLTPSSISQNLIKTPPTTHIFPGNSNILEFTALFYRWINQVNQCQDLDVKKPGFRASTLFPGRGWGWREGASLEA